MKVGFHLFFGFCFGFRHYFPTEEHNYHEINIFLGPLGITILDGHEDE